MKHVLIACVVFALCLAVGLFSLFYVRASGAQTNELLERSIRQAETEDYTGAAASLRQAKQVWEGRERILGIFLHHEEVDEVIALFAQLEQFIRLEDLDDYLAACHELTARLEHIRRMELPTPGSRRRSAALPDTGSRPAPAPIRGQGAQPRLPALHNPVRRS